MNSWQIAGAVEHVFHRPSTNFGHLIRTVRPRLPRTSPSIRGDATSTTTRIGLHIIGK
jgi:hypothetical protein